MANLTELITQLEEAVSLNSESDTVMQVKEILCQSLKAGFALPEDKKTTCKEHYARHLIHADPEGLFSIVAMVWGPGQATPLHDHGDLWCVEGLLEGSVEVCMYKHRDSKPDGTEIFEESFCVYPGCGDTGHLIPPEDHHIIRNTSSTESAITIHIYGGEMEECTVFEPTGQENEYKRRTHKPCLDSQ